MSKARVKSTKAVGRMRNNGAGVPPQAGAMPKYAKGQPVKFLHVAVEYKTYKGRVFRRVVEGTYIKGMKELGEMTV